MRKRAILYPVFLPLLILIGGWGWQGHQKISLSITNSFTTEMGDLVSWAEFMSDHGSDADYRKGEDPGESPRHYIDIDNYPGFVTEGRIPHTLDSCELIYGAGFVEDNGYLPWATYDTYNRLVQYFMQEDWQNAKLAAADLGHYVADGFMPMHITKNYNGQLTGSNYGIHSRYESDMIRQFNDQIVYGGSPVIEIEDIQDYIFSYLYKNYSFVDSILFADNYAQSVAGGNSGSIYYENLWEITGEFTIDLFKGASHALANLLYNAWREAGKPIIDETEPEVIAPVVILNSDSLYQSEVVQVTSTKMGMIYLVPENTESDLSSIRNNCIDSANVLANFIVHFQIGGLENGTYWFYSRDTDDVLSVAVPFTITGVGISPFIFTEYEVYPNPFRESVNISFTLKKRENLLIKVMDSKGRILAHLNKGTLEPGAYSFYWTVGNTGPGVYFLIMETGDGIIVRRVLVDG